MAVKKGDRFHALTPTCLAATVAAVLAPPIGHTAMLAMRLNFEEMHTSCSLGAQSLHAAG
jgi:hypothetical protein